MLSIVFATQASAQAPARVETLRPIERVSMQPIQRRPTVSERTEPQNTSSKKKNVPAKNKKKSTMQADHVGAASLKDSSKVSLVYLEHSETLSFDEERLPDVQILKGNVCFRHDSALMYCDSAYFYELENSLRAFGHVHLLQGDSIEGFGDMLYYNGNTKMARFRSNVKLIHQNSILTTDSLNYDRKRDIAYYFSGGMIEDNLNTLTSSWGQYTPYNHQAVFRGGVHLINPKFVLNADTLWYNTESYRADLVGPTEILYEEETTILSTKGWYNTQTEHSMLLDRSRVIHTDGMTLTGDTIYYDKHQGYGRVYGNMQSVDSTNKMTLYGNRGEVWETDKRGYVTDSALLVEWSDSVSYSYMHADTLFTREIDYQVFIIPPPDSVLVDSIWTVLQQDTIWKDTSYLSVKAYYNVRIYREDMQSVCDSMHYNGKDSIVTLCGDPVCWNGYNQVSADSIRMYIKKGTLDYLHGVGNAIAIKQEGSSEFDQLAGKEMYAYLRDGDVYLVDVQGNAETIFYPREEDGSFLGVNRTQSSFVKLYLENRQIHHVVFTTTTTGVMIPMDQVTDEEKHLMTFFWAEQERPQSPKDVFLRPSRTVRPDASAVSASSDDEETDDEVDTRRSKGTPKVGGIQTRNNR